MPCTSAPCLPIRHTYTYAATASTAAASPQLFCTSAHPQACRALQHLASLQVLLRGATCTAAAFNRVFIHGVAWGTKEMQEHKTLVSATCGQQQARNNIRHSSGLLQGPHTWGCLQHKHQQQQQHQRQCTECTAALLDSSGPLLGLLTWGCLLEQQQKQRQQQ
jgi:hypothetical protein